MLNEKTPLYRNVPFEGRHGIAEGLWLQALLEERKTTQLNKSWPIEKNPNTVDLPDYLTVCFENWRETSRDIFARSEEALLHLAFSKTRIDISLAGNEKDQLDKILKQLQTTFPEMKATENTVPISLWYNKGTRSDSYERKIKIPHWDEIRDNYSAQTQTDLDKLMDWSKLPSVGKLVIFTGRPGTGKTYAIRAIADKWKDWCKMDYITDPERFFDDPKYMLDILLKDEDLDCYEEDCDEKQEANKSKLIALEDAGELITIDSKANNGQALSRLLNMTDGIIGQGLNFLLLITTNEDIKALNEAVMRPGRCLANIQFDLFKKSEAEEWAKKHNFSIKVHDRDFSLSELYTLKNGDSLPPSKTKRTGFK